jgi:hypothetical protein
MDADLNTTFYKPLDTYEFLVVRSEENLLSILDDLKDAISSRGSIIDDYNSTIEKMEQERATVIGNYHHYCYYYYYHY